LWALWVVFGISAYIGVCRRILAHVGVYRLIEIRTLFAHSLWKVHKSSRL